MLNGILNIEDYSEYIVISNIESYQNAIFAIEFPKSVLLLNENELQEQFYTAADNLLRKELSVKSPIEILQEQIDAIILASLT